MTRERSVTAALALAHTDTGPVSQFYDLSSPCGAQRVWLQLVADIQSGKRLKDAKDTGFDE